MDIQRFVLKEKVSKNPLLRFALRGLQVFGYVIFDSQQFPRLNCFRGMLLSVYFGIFNISQV